MAAFSPTTESGSRLSTLTRMMNGYQVTQGIHVMARLKIADLLHDGPRSPEAIADRCGADPETLRRLLRALESVGLVRIDADGEVAITELGDLLRTDHSQSAWPMAELVGDPLRWDAWEDLYGAVTTGTSSFTRVHGAPLFPYLAAHPDLARRFDDVMTMSSRHSLGPILDACDLGTSRLIVDVGGGQGALLRAVLARYPQANGILYDLPQVGESREMVGTPEAGRFTFMGGDMFTAIPAGADTYLFRRVLHDWDDDACLTILRNCRRAIAPGGRLLACEAIVPEGSGYAPEKWNDLHMLMMCGGKERTCDEFADLFAAAGFALVSVSPAGSVAVIEGTPV
ncbi:MAG: methyltransferase [Thermomicrobiales bacterium]